MINLRALSPRVGFVWVCLGVLVIGSGRELALFVRRRKARKGPDRHKAMEAVRARWVSGVPSEFSDPKVCFETMLAVKWPDGKVTCPKCGHDKVYIIRTRSLLQCKSKTCKKQFIDN